MNTRRVICAMCGAQFDPSEHAACQFCPLQPGCQLVCCPVCGYETVDASKSVIARLATRIMAGATRWRSNPGESDENTGEV